MNSLADLPAAASPDLRLLPAPGGTAYHPQETISNHASVSIAIGAPVARVYQRWLQYPDFPHFMRGKAGEDPEEFGRITWRIQVGEFKSPWEAEVVSEVAQEKISWESTNGRPSRNRGSVSFHAAGDDRTQVAIAIEFEFPRFSPPDQYPLAVLVTRLERCLMAFAEFAKAKVS